MDDKQKNIISRLIDKINQEVFEEIDVLTLLILIRDFSPKHGLTRELGDFIAHRQRDRGQFYEYLEKNSEKYIDTNVEKNIFIALVNDKAHATPKIILQDINATLLKIETPALNNKLSNAIAYCIASLLQKVKFQNKIDEIIGETFIIYTPNGAALVAKTPNTITSLFPFEASYDGLHFEEDSYAITPNNFTRVHHDKNGIQVEYI